MSGRAHRSYTLDFKLHMIQEAERERRVKKDFGSKYGITPSTLLTSLKNKEKTISQCGRRFSGKRKRMHSSPSEVVDKALFLRIKKARAKKVPLRGPIIKKKANQLASENGDQPCGDNRLIPSLQINSITSINVHVIDFYLYLRVNYKATDTLYNKILLQQTTSSGITNFL